jgi:hypothetical protein
VLFLCMLIAVLIAMSFRGSRWFRIRDPGIQGKGAGQAGPCSCRQCLRQFGGGRLLIGVTDSAEIIGCELENLADRFTIVHAHCEPAPSFTTGALTVRQTSLVVVKVNNGDDKPYTVKDHGTYVRVGATTRGANRHEMDRLYASKQPQLWR